MISIRNWYIYIVCTLTVLASAWSAVDILRTLVVDSNNLLGSVGSIALLIVALPVFLIHWLWAQRLAAANQDEAVSLERSLYLNGIAAGFLGPVVGYSFATLAALLRALFAADTTVTSFRDAGRTPLQNVLFYAVPVVVMGVFWLYQQRVLNETNALPRARLSRALQRIVRLGFAVAGVAALTFGIAQLLVILIDPLITVSTLNEPIVAVNDSPLREAARIIVGLALWLGAWRVEQRAATPDRGAPAYHAWYHQLVVVGLTIAALTAAGSLLNILLQALLGVPLDNQFGRGVLRALAGLAATLPLLRWHAMQLAPRATLIDDGDWSAATADRTARTVIAGIGLAALLGGLAGLLTIIIRQPSDPLTGRVQLATYLAVLLIGVPVWLWRWRPLQAQAAGSDKDAAIARATAVRQVYLYLFMLAAIVTILASTVFVVTQLLNWLLGGEPIAARAVEMAQALSYTALAALVLAYHSRLLANDRRLNEQAQRATLAALRVTVLDLPGSDLASRLQALLQERLAGLTVQTVGTQQEDESADLATLAASDMIIAPANFGALPSVAVRDAVAAATGRKFLLPTSAEGWTWIGTAYDSQSDLYRAVADAVERTAQEDRIRVRRQLGFLSFIGLVVALLIFLGILSAIISSF